MVIEQQLKDFILDRYDTISAFCAKSNLATSTLHTVFKRGINKTSTNTILKICTALGIDSQALLNNEIKIIHNPNLESDACDISEMIYEIESSSKEIQYNGTSLTHQQRAMIAFGMRFALQMSLKNSLPE